jgi:hypothetical protein
VESTHATVVFAVEPYQQVLPELKELIGLHWKEIALNQDKIKLAPDYDGYAAMCGKGILHIITARHEEKLVGYFVSLVGKHLHYANDVMGIGDIFFLKPEYRKGMTGVNLLRVFEAEMRKLGVRKIIAGTKLHHNLTRVFEHLGWKETDRMFAKWIED